jgi:hypothetical protein
MRLGRPTLDDFHFTMADSIVPPAFFVMEASIRAEDIDCVA